MAANLILSACGPTPTETVDGPRSRHFFSALIQKPQESTVAYFIIIDLLSLLS